MQRYKLGKTLDMRSQGLSYIAWSEKGANAERKGALQTLVELYSCYDIRALEKRAGRDQVATQNHAAATELRS